MTTADLPWHPFWVHFPIAAWLLGSGVLLTAFVAGRKSWNGHGWLLLILGAIFSIPAALTGQNEFTRAAMKGAEVLERHQLIGNLLPWLMGIIVLWKGHTVLKKENGPEIPDWLWCLLVSAVSALVLYAGYLGGILVYDRGLRL